MRRHDRRTIRNAEASCDAILNDGGDPEAVVMVGIGSGVEAKVFMSRFKDAALYGVEAHPVFASNAQSLMDVTCAAIVPHSEGQSTVEFYLRNGRSMASSLHTRGSSADRKIEVPAITLDQFFEDKQLFGKRVWLYMDCEGCELGAMQGGEKAMTTVEWIHTEVKATRCARVTWPLADRVVSYIESNGFELLSDYRRAGGRRKGNGDVLFRRRSVNEE